jgi:uncharacterized protein YjbI with pentapeptide repeats
MALENGKGIVNGYMIDSASNLRGADLRGVDLTKAMLLRADLTGADLTDSDLTRAALKNAVLIDAILTKANLTETIFQGANLTNAKMVEGYLNLTFAQEAILINVDFSNATVNARFRDADLTDSNFTESYARGTRFEKATLINANFTKADLYGCDFGKADLSGANFTDADARGCNFERADLSDVIFTGCKLDRAMLKGATYSTKTDFSGAIDLDKNLIFAHGIIIELIGNWKFRDLDFHALDFLNRDLSDRNWVNVDCSNANFSGSNLSKSNFWNCNLTGADFTDANIHKLRFGSDTNFTDSIYDKENILIVRHKTDPHNVSTVTDLRNFYQEQLVFSKTDFKSLKFGKLYFVSSVFNDVNFDRCNLVESNLQYTNFTDSNFTECLLTEASFKQAEFKNVDFTDSDLTEADFRYAKFEKATFTGAYLVDADFMGAKFTDVDFTNANLSGANLSSVTYTNVDFTGADLTDADYDYEKIKSASGLDKAIGYGVRITAKSYGAMTGPILKLGKPDSPTNASEFKRRYPSEFERLKSDTAGRDFTENMKKSLREKYVTPFYWIIKKTAYREKAQRISEKPNRVLLLNVDISDLKYTEKQKTNLKKLSEVSRRSNHPHANYPLFTIGWIRYDVNDEAKVLLIEEVQSDIEIVRKKLKGESSETQQLRRAGIDPKDFAEVAELMQPYSDRLYEDAIGLIFQEAEALGYTVEMLPYEAKKDFCYYDEELEKEICPPISVYVELPKRLGMTARRESQSLPNLPAPVRYYKPNPGKRSK